MTSATDAASPLVVVVGSVNLDIVADLDHLPRAGETLIARTVRRNVGGKGANQAVAAQIACGAVAFVGRVGDDGDGRRLVGELSDRRVMTEFVGVVAGESSGAAYIAVAGGQNTIVVASGANDSFHLRDDERAAIAGAPVVLCQLEIPDTVVAAVAIGSTGRFILNAAPARGVDDAVLRRCDPVVVNENELAALTGDVIDGPTSAIRAVRRLRDRGAISVVATLGAAGSIWADVDGVGHQPAAAVDVLDSTGAGDQFVGAMAARLAIGDGLAAAIRWATAAASISVQRPGTLDSYPDSDTIERATGSIPEPSRR